MSVPERGGTFFHVNVKLLNRAGRKEYVHANVEVAGAYLSNELPHATLGAHKSKTIGYLLQDYSNDNFTLVACGARAV